MGQLYSRHICRLDPWPDPVLRCLEHIAQPVYNTLQGLNEFVVDGTFKDWDRWADIADIRIPTLLLVGRHDSMAVADIEEMGWRMPEAEVRVLENDSHLSMWDDEEPYFLIAFLQSCGDQGPHRS